MGSHSPISNGPESSCSPRRSPSPPPAVKSSLLSQSKTGVAEKTSGSTENAAKDAAVTMEVGTNVKSDQSKTAPRCAYRQTAPIGEETENGGAAAESKSHDAADFSPPRVYYRSFRDQGELGKVKIVDFFMRNAK